MHNTEITGFLFSGEQSSVQDFGLIAELGIETANKRHELSLQLILCLGVYSVSQMTVVDELQSLCRIL